MKIVKDIEKRIKRTRESMEGCGSREKKSITKNIEDLKLCARYLETNPTQEFIEKQLLEVNRKIVAVESNYGEWAGAHTAKYGNPKSAHATQMNIKVLRNQAKTLTFLLEPEII